MHCKELLLLLTIGQVMTEVSTGSSTCDPHYPLQYGTSCYFIGLLPKTWSEAREICQNMDGDLVAIETYGEDSFLYQQIKSLPVLTNVYYWTGGYQNLAIYKDQWKWMSTDQSIPFNSQYSRWKSGQPSSLFEHCLNLLCNENCEWNDARCSLKFPFVCEQMINKAKNK
ncbi:C-type lectin domain family 4 member E [Lingula anatina]|uniref:C-type lectin domain family 4 member E n=1 Tax=Lingula anatina TaxID=7574 RepID=A0A1S3JG13_LINAN|nr:C-type lectin domain family 4 member E [Lingula anatina]|eukprot:XP_013408839.1 C-type lectin domain family 4 member E [Lingula anatina]